jgi:hypothetical protein
MLPWQRVELSACLCSCLGYPALNPHSPYYTVICGLLDSIIFFQIISHMAWFSDLKCVFGFSLQLFCRPFCHSKKYPAWHYHSCATSPHKVPVSRATSPHKVPASRATSPHKVPVILVRCKSNLIFLGRFSKNPQILNFMEIRLLGDQLLQADSRNRDMTKLTAAFLKFVNRPTEKNL